MDRLRELLASIARGFGHFTPAQRLSMALIAGTVLVSLVMLAFLSRTAEYIPLVSGMSVNEQIHVQTILQGKDIPFKAVGNSIRVTTADHSRAIAELALQPGGMAFSQINLLGAEETDRGFSPETGEQRRERRVKDRELKLGMVIGCFQDVSGAVVLLDIPDQTLFLPTENYGSASVFVTTSHGDKLNRGAQTSIKQLVAAASRKLRPQDVTLTDSMGTPYDTMDDSEASVASRKFEVRRAREKDFEQKILGILTPAFGYGKVRVSVHLKLNWDRTKSDRIEYDPSKDAVEVSTETRTETSTEAAVGGASGDSSNTQASIATVSQPGSTRKSNEEKIELVIGSTKTSLVKDSPVVVASSAQVTIDTTRLDEMAQAADKSADEILSEQKQSVANLIGAEPTDVSVLAYPFAEIPEAPSPSLSDMAFGYLSRYAGRIALLLVALVALGVMRSIVKKSVPRPQILLEEKPEAGTEEEILAELEAPDAEAVRAAKIREKVMEVARENPAAASMLLRRWISKG